MFKQIVFLSTVLFMAPSWAVNKCAGVDGKVVFQDAPCSDGAKNLTAQSESPSTVKPSAVMSPADVARSLEAQIDQPATQKKIQQNIETRQLLERAGAAARRAGSSTLCGGELQSQPSVGMSEDQFLNCTRFAQEWDHLQVNETETKFGVRKQYVYAHHAPVKYIYVDRGKITAISR